MAADTSAGVHPITVHLREAAKRIRLANFGIPDDHREVIELDETFSALSVVVIRLLQVIGHLRSIVSGADAEIYDYDDDDDDDDGSHDPDVALQFAETCLDDAIKEARAACRSVGAARSAMAHLRVRDTSTDPVW